MFSEPGDEEKPVAYIFYVVLIYKCYILRKYVSILVRNLVCCNLRFEVMCRAISSDSANTGCGDSRGRDAISLRHIPVVSSKQD